MLIFDLWGISFHFVVVFGLGKDILLKSVLGSIVKCLVHLYFSADVLCKYVSALLHVRIYCYSVSIFCAIAFMQLEHRAIVVERNEFASVIQDRTGVPSLLKTASFCSFSALLSTW